MTAANQTSIFRSGKKLHSLWGDFSNTSMLLGLFTFPFNVNHTSSKQNMHFRSRNSLTTSSWNHLLTCSSSALLPSLKKRVDIWLILFRCSFKSFDSLWAENFGTPLWTANQHKAFLCIFSIWVPVSYNYFFQLQHKICTLSFSRALNMSSQVFPLLCTLFFYTALLL